MLALDRPPREQPSYSNQFPMDPPAVNNSFDFLTPNSQQHQHQQRQQQDHRFFGAYNPPSPDSYPFIIQPNLALNSSLLYSKTSDPTAIRPTSSGLSYIPSTSQSPDPHSSGSSSSISSHSVPSATSSSSTGSPYQDRWLDIDPGIATDPVTMVSDGYSNEFLAPGIDPEVIFANNKFSDCFVDPALLQPIQQPCNFPDSSTPYPEDAQYGFVGSPAFTPISPTIPSLHRTQTPQQQQRPTHHQPQPLGNRNSSPYLSQTGFSNSLTIPGRRSSISSTHSRHSAHTPPTGNAEVDEDSNENRCPHPRCGRIFRDLKAHMLTHQSERPEKCPIVNCEYHLKGFARKYDKNRHTLTHYKGTMVCGFCPGSGSAAEKSFNRADVFKRHLTCVHGVDQSAPNGRKKSPPSSSAGKLSNYCQDATGKCSTCTSTFNNAQEFYEHLDDCVLRVVQQEEPSEAINLQRLAEVESDDDVRETMERHMLVDSTTTNTSIDGNDNHNNDDSSPASNNNTNGNATKGLMKLNTMTKSSAAGSGGVTKGRPIASRRRNNRNNYPPSWGCPTNKMKMKRRLLCLYDGPRRLWKDEMMLDNEFEVRLKLPSSDGMGREPYVTDLDVETLKRSEGVHNATDEEKGIWIPGSTPDRLLGPAAVPILGNVTEMGEEINIDELMA